MPSSPVFRCNHVVVGTTDDVSIVHAQLNIVAPDGTSGCTIKGTPSPANINLDGKTVLFEALPEEGKLYRLRLEEVPESALTAPTEQPVAGQDATPKAPPLPTPAAVKAASAPDAAKAAEADQA